MIRMLKGKSGSLDSAGSSQVNNNNTHTTAKPGSKSNPQVTSFAHHSIDLNCQASVDTETMERLPKYYVEHGHFMTHLHDDARTMIESFERGHRINPGGNCLGRIDAQEKKAIYSSYAQVYERIQKFGSGVHCLLSGSTKGKTQAVAIYSANRVEYVVAEYACHYHSFVVVPVYDTLGPNVCSFILNQAEIECIVCDGLERIQTILSHEGTYKSLRYIVVFDDIPQSYKIKAMSSGLKVFTMDEIEQMGVHNPSEPHRPSPSKLAVICYTSGTTGTPKGVMLSHGNIIANVSAVMHQMLDHTLRMDDIMLSYLPLAHMFERNCQSAMFMVGGSVVFFSGDVKTLSNDMKIAQPTLLPAVPRLLTRIYCKILDSVKGSVLKNFLLNTACYFKQKQFDRRVVHNNTIWDRIIFRKIRENLGGRIRLIMCGSAPLNPNVLEFLRCTLGCVILEGYGQTESVAPCTVSLPSDFSSGSVGPPIAAASIKLIDVAEMGYYAANNQGEILVRGPILFQGYFKDEQRTRDTIDAEGWLHTGDIGELRDNQTLTIIDRKKNMFKLSQGEYIAPEKIENTYSQCPMIAQVFVYGESLKSSLVAIVVPDQASLESWARANNISVADYHLLCRNSEVKKMLLKEMYSLGLQDGLKSFEQVKDIYVHADLLSIQSGLITPTFKSKRKEIFTHFKKEIDEIYSRFD